MSTNKANPYSSPQSSASNDPSGLSYKVFCSCGSENPVLASAAGGTISCQKCGHNIVVPMLSQLRKMAGKGAYETGTIDTIRRMINLGELPQGEHCLISGRLTDHVVTVYVQCERRWIRVASSNKKSFLLFATLFLPFWWVWFLLYESHRESPEVLGHDILVRIPLRIHEECCRELKRASQRRLRHILRAVPIYDQLLKEHPYAKILFRV